MTVDVPGGITTDGYDVNADHRDYPAWKKGYNRGGKRVVQDKFGEWKDEDQGLYLNRGYWNGVSTPNPYLSNLSGFDADKPLGANNDAIGAWAEAVPATYSASYGGAFPRYDENSLDARFEPVVDSGSGRSSSSRTFYTLNGRYVPGGSNGVMLEGTKDTDYRKLFLVDWELTVDHESYRGYYSTPVYAIAPGGGGSLDRQRNATTSSIWWVKQNEQQWYSLAWNLSESQNEGTGWGLFNQYKYGLVESISETGGTGLIFDKPGFIPGTSFLYSGRSLHTLAYASSERYGPFFVGVTSNGTVQNSAGQKDKHYLGVNEDGEEINSGHIHTQSYFSNGSYTYDAPLRFQARDYPDVEQNFNLYMEVILGFDKRMSHFHETGTKPGMWRWWTQSPVYMVNSGETGVEIKATGAGGGGGGDIPDISIPTDLDLYIPKQYDDQKPYLRPIPAHGTTGILTRSATDQLREQGQNQEFGSTGLTGRASDGMNRFFAFQLDPGTTNRYGFPEGYRMNPVTWHIASLAKINTIGQYDMTQQPYQTAHQGGTVDNNVYFSPPEFYGDSRTIPTGTPASEGYSQVYWNWHPSIPFGVCVPTTDFATRYDGRHDGWSFLSTGVSGSRNTDLYFYDNSGTPDSQRDGTFTVHGNIAVTGTTCGFWSRDAGNVALYPSTAGDDLWLPDSDAITFGNTTAAPDVSVYFDGSALQISHAANTHTVLGGSRLETGFGGNNIMIGVNSGNGRDPGAQYNIGIGDNTLDAGLTATADSNVGLGTNALTDLISGYGNMAIGTNALANCTSGFKNVAIGTYALLSLTTQQSNIAIGENSLRTTNGAGNVGIGSACFQNMNNYNYNVGIGMNVALNNDGSTNTFIGYSSGFSGANLNGCVFIGHKSGYYETASNKLFIDNAQRASEADGRAKALMYGIFDAAVASQHLYTNANRHLPDDIYDYYGSSDDASIRFNNTAGVLEVEYPALILNNGYAAVDTKIRSDNYTMIKVDGTNDLVQLGDTVLGDMVQIDEDGSLTLHGDARKYVIEWMAAVAGWENPAKSPTFTKYGSGSALIFSDGADVEAIVNIALPLDADRDEDMLLCIGWNTPTTTADCNWEIDYISRALNEDPAEVAAIISLQSYEESSSTANGENLSTFTIANANIGDTDLCLHVTIRRDATDVNDTLGDVARLFGVSLKYVKKNMGANI